MCCLCQSPYWLLQLYRIADQINQQPCEAYNNEMSRYEALFGVRSMRTVHPPPELAASVLQLNRWAWVAQPCAAFQCKHACRWKWVPRPRREQQP